MRSTGHSRCRFTRPIGRQNRCRRNGRFSARPASRGCGEGRATTYPTGIRDVDRGTRGLDDLLHARRGSGRFLNLVAARTWLPSAARATARDHHTGRSGPTAGHTGGGGAAGVCHPEHPGALSGHRAALSVRLAGRRSVAPAATDAQRQLHALVVAAPDLLRGRRGLTTPRLVSTCGAAAPAGRPEHRDDGDRGQPARPGPQHPGREPRDRRPRRGPYQPDPDLAARPARTHWSGSGGGRDGPVCLVRYVARPRYRLLEAQPTL